MVELETVWLNGPGPGPGSAAVRFTPLIGYRYMIFCQGPVLWFNPKRETVFSHRSCQTWRVAKLQFLPFSDLKTS